MNAKFVKSLLVVGMGLSLAACASNDPEPKKEDTKVVEDKKEEKKEEKATDFVVSKNYNKKYEIIITMPEDFTTIYTPAEGVKVTGEIVDDTILSQMAADILETDLDNVIPFGVDTDISPYDSGSYASAMP